MKPPAKLFTRKVLQKIKQDHIRLYEARIKSGSEYINVPECEYYLSVWKGIGEKTYNELNLREKHEVDDAVEDGSYDDLLHPSRDTEDEEEVSGDFYGNEQG